MKHTQIAHILVHAVPGESIGHCIKEAMEIALQRWDNMLLIHDEKEYPVFVNDLFCAVFEAGKIREARKNKEDDAT